MKWERKEEEEKMPSTQHPGIKSTNSRVLGARSTTVLQLLPYLNNFEAAFLFKFLALRRINLDKNKLMKKSN